MNSKIYFASLLIFFSYQLSAQNYVPTAVDSATWLIDSWGEWSPPEHYALRIEGDSLYTGISYKKLYRYDLESDRTVLSRRLIGLMRDDVPNRKVYGVLFDPIYLPGPFDGDTTCIWSNSREILLYDFDLTVGDLSSDCHIMGSNFNTQVETESVQEHFGLSRRTLGSQNSTLIEGIGYAAGLLLEGSNAIAAGIGIRMYDYCIGSLWDCSLRTSTEELSEQSLATLYPNPTQDKIYINTDLRLRQISIYDLQGRLLRTPKASKKEIDLSPLDPGTYLIKLVSQEGLTQTQRLMKL
jgi:hypothetical protein